MTNEGESQTAFYTIGTVADFPLDKMRSARVGRMDVVVYKQADGWHAYSNYCTHIGALLTSGWVADGQVHCPFHYARFDINTGECVAGPGYSALPVFNIRIEGADVQVELPVPADGQEPAIELQAVNDRSWTPL